MAAALAVSCGGTTTEQLVGPTTASRCQIGLSAPPPVPASGTNLSLNVSTARDCTWTAEAAASWLSVTPRSGQGTAALTVSVAANPLGTSRSAAITLNGARITIDQEGLPCRFDLGDRSAHVGADGGRRIVRLIAVEGCDWRASTPVDWVRVLTPSGTGSATIDLDVSRNDGGHRSTTITIAGVPFTIEQDSRSGGSPSGEPPPGQPPGGGSPPSPDCTFSIDPDRASFRAAAAQGSVRVTTQSGCSWTASSGAPWITMAKANGTGSDSVTYGVALNPSTVSERSGGITVAGRAHRVTQQACELSIEPGHPHLPASDSSYSFAVTTSPGCTWTAVSTASWIGILRGSGSGSGHVLYQLAANTERGREATIVVSGRVKQITQYGPE